MAARYVYGVVSAGARPEAYRTVAGLDDGAVSLVASGAVAALVSPAAGERARGSRANLSAHQRVVEAAHQAGPVLPVRFGTVMPDDDAVIAELLAPYEADLERALADMSGKSEFRVKATYLTDVAIRDAVDRDAGIRRMRAALARRGHGGYHERIELGERVAAAVDQIKAADEEALFGRLEALAVPLRRLEPSSSDVALYVAALVDRRGRTRFEQAVEDMAKQQAERLRFELAGPLAPWDFVDLHGTGRDRAAVGG